MSGRKRPKKNLSVRLLRACIHIRVTNIESIRREFALLLHFMDLLDESRNIGADQTNCASSPNVTIESHFQSRVPACSAKDV